LALGKAKVFHRQSQEWLPPEDLLCVDTDGREGCVRVRQMDGQVLLAHERRRQVKC
jgi:hypothetical protein